MRQLGRQAWQINERLREYRLIRIPMRLQIYTDRREVGLVRSRERPGLNCHGKLVVLPASVQGSVNCLELVGSQQFCRNGKIR